MNARRMAYWWFRFVVSGRFQAASPLIHHRDDGRILVSSPQPDDLSLRAMPRRAECRLRTQAWDSRAERPGKREEAPVEVH